MPVRVLFWSELFWPYIGGAEVFAARLIEAERQRGFELAVITAHDYLELPDDAVHGGVPIRRLPFRSALASRSIDALMEVGRRATEHVRAFAPDVIHLNGIGAGSHFCLRAAQAVGAPLLLRLNRELSATQATESLAQRLLGAAAWVAAVSPQVLQQARRIAPQIEPRSSLVLSGVEVPRQCPEPPPNGAARILCLGRLVPDKGFDIALDALPAILRHAPTARMTIAGDGPEAAALRERAAILGVTDRVDFAGWVAPDEVPALMSSATLLVMPSRTEGLPLVGLQAAAMGRPVVASRNGGLPAVVEHGETGLLVDLEAAALAGAICRLLDDAEARVRLGAAAWRRARELFTLEQCAEAYAHLYRALC